MVIGKKWETAFICLPAPFHIPPCIYTSPFITLYTLFTISCSTCHRASLTALPSASSLPSLYYCFLFHTFFCIFSYIFPVSFPNFPFASSFPSSPLRSLLSLSPHLRYVSPTLLFTYTCLSLPFPPWSSPLLPAPSLPAANIITSLLSIIHNRIRARIGLPPPPPCRGTEILLRIHL